MNQDKNNKQILLLPAPKTPTVENTANTENGGIESDARKYGENTGRDPTTGRFTTGNAGKPVGTQHFSTMFKRVIRQKGGVSKDGEDVPFDEIIVKKIVTMAAGGNLSAAEIVLDRVDGKVKQPVEVTGPGKKVKLKDEEIIIHETMFKGHDQPKADDSASKSDSRGAQDPSGSKTGSAYEPR